MEISKEDVAGEIIKLAEKDLSEFKPGLAAEGALAAAALFPTRYAFYLAALCYAEGFQFERARAILKCALKEASDSSISKKDIKDLEKRIQHKIKAAKEENLLSKVLSELPPDAYRTRYDYKLMAMAVINSKYTRKSKGALNIAKEAIENALKLPGGTGFISFLDGTTDRQFGKMMKLLYKFSEGLKH